MRFPYHLFRKPHRGGFALVLVLAFVTLLVGVCLAFFSNSILQRQISTSSATRAKTELIAQGAIDTTIADLKQEIVAGSTVVTLTPASAGKIYPPKLAGSTTATPTIVPYSFVPAGNAGLENLLKWSSYKLPFFGGGNYSSPGKTRAANIGTSVPSQNGRSVTAARWNKPLFLPPKSTDNFEPSVSFTDPEWILVSKDPADPNPTKENNKVIGRYAYTIYNEGGLLDINVAGYPTNYNRNATDKLKFARKGGQPFIDLSQLSVTADGNPLLTNEQIDSIIGWRNYASGQFSGNFPTFTTSSTSADYIKAIAGDTTGYLKAANNQLAGGVSDRKFIGRQDFIRFLQDLSGGILTKDLQTSLQYLTTFSRDLNQPSFDPNFYSAAVRLKMLGSYTSGGNDGSGHEADINPPFLKIRVKSSFLRYDGTTALAGEPLVKKRFSLNRLAWLTYKGESANRNFNSPSSSEDADIKTVEENGIAPEFLKLGDHDTIQKYFGLVWNTAGYWEYSPVSGGSDSIRTLPEVAALNREPNFIELLKASISAGSVAKNFYVTDTGANEVNDDQRGMRYSSVDCAYFQIAANIIDQFDGDGYPTQIQAVLKVYSKINTYGFFGVENIPYFYRVRNAALLTQRPSTSGIYPTKDGKTTGAAAKPTGEGEITWLQEPEIWNPHGWNSNANAVATGYGMGNPRPQKFYLTGETLVNRIGGSIGIQLAPVGDHAPNNGITLDKVTTLTKAELDFDIPRTALGAGLFREPTLLITPLIPSGSNLRAVTQANIVAYGSPLAYNGRFPAGLKNSPLDSNVTNPYLGFVFGATWACWGDGTSTYSARYIQPTPHPVSGPFNSDKVIMIYTLSCENPAGGQIQYDQKYGKTICVATDNLPASTVFDTNSRTIGSYQDTMIPSWNSYSCVDPRTARFGMQVNQGGQINGAGVSQQYMTPPRVYSDPINAMTRWVSPEQNIVESERPDFNSGYGVGYGWSTDPPSKLRSLTGVFPQSGGTTGWFWGTGAIKSTGSPTGYSGKSNWRFVHGLFAQNNRYTRGAPDISGTDNGRPFDNDPGGAWYFDTPQCFADADSVIRRGMAAYLPAPSTNSNKVTAGQPLATSVTYDSSAMATPITLPFVDQTPPKSMMIKKGINGTGGGTDVNITTGTIQSRPIILNRPFRSVGELGQVFSDTPWRNLDFSTPESGCTGLLDVFSIQDTDDSTGMVAGKVNLNTQQKPVLRAILSGAYQNEYGDTDVLPVPPKLASAMVDKLYARTTTMGLPMATLGELVGKQVIPLSTQRLGLDGSDTKNFAGFSSDLSSITASEGADNNFLYIPRFREAAVRALAQAGTARVWNLMIDVVAQSGRYPSGVSGLEKFFVEGEQRYWVHVAIDRYTGKVIDKQVEIVKE